MTEILMLIFVAIAVEVLRRYFFVYWYCEENFRSVYIFPATFIVVGMVMPYWLRDYSSILLVVLFSLVDYLLMLIIDYREYRKQIRNGIKEKEPSAEEEKLAVRQHRVFLLSYLLPILACTDICVRVDNADSKVFEQQWQQTKAVTIIEEPVRTVIRGNENVAFETENGDVVIQIKDGNIDFLRMQKGDKIRFLEIGSRKRFEIVTLRGEAYK